QEIRMPKGSSNADLIRNPISADAPADAGQMASINFSQPVFDFGDIDDKNIVSHTFEFTNTGKAPLVIAHVRGNCGCTVPHWPKDPIAPGAGGKIEVRFDPSGKEGPQNKPIVVTANTYPNATNITIMANVKASGESGEQ
ncbi:MAG TPA: DUF1573 domain-containing protein, partial [Saprospiraceae bacterium]|nr:DUF1573 domain-containing protein [Saprospiraceae bacterium]